MQIRFLLVSVCLFANILFATTYPPTSPEITLHGRYYIEEGAVKYDWTCFQIEFCFTSSKIQWLVQDSWNFYQINIDGQMNQKIQPKKNKSLIIFESQSPETHCMQIVKITENHYGPIASHKDSIFNGINVQGGKLSKSNTKYDYRFQFFGDSLTTAFGVDGTTNPFCMRKMIKIQNCLQSWATLLSKKFNADYRIQAVSGKGLVRNSIGVPGPRMPSLFSRFSDNSPVNSYNYQDGFVPDILFIFIGANDYNSLKKPTIQGFVSAQKQLLQTIARKQFAATGKISRFACICDRDEADRLCESVQQGIREFNYAYKYAYYLELPKGTMSAETMGCIGHPNSKGHIKIAEGLYEGVRKILQS